MLDARGRRIGGTRGMVDAPTVRRVLDGRACAAPVDARHGRLARAVARRLADAVSAEVLHVLYVGDFGHRSGYRRGETVPHVESIGDGLCVLCLTHPVLPDLVLACRLPGIVHFARRGVPTTFDAWRSDGIDLRDATPSRIAEALRPPAAAADDGHLPSLAREMIGMAAVVAVTMVVGSTIGTLAGVMLSLCAGLLYLVVSERLDGRNARRDVPGDAIDDPWDHLRFPGAAAMRMRIDRAARILRGSIDLDDVQAITMTETTPRRLASSTRGFEGLDLDDRDVDASDARTGEALEAVAAAAERRVDLRRSAAEANHMLVHDHALARSAAA